MNRIQPQMGAEAYKTYSIVAPASSHFRPATCAETDCPDYLNGWRVRVEGLPPDMLHAARTSGRKYVEVRIAEGETWLHFEPGQACFRAGEHRVRLDKPELFLVRDGDFRGQPTRHQDADASAARALGRGLRRAPADHRRTD
jgi:hypothetical protein